MGKKPIRIRADLVAKITPEDLLEGILENSRRYKPEPLLSTTGKGYLAPTTPEDRERNLRRIHEMQKKFDPTRDPYACEPGKEKEAANRRFCEHLHENPEEFSEEIFVRRLSEVLRRGFVSRRKAASVLKMELEDLERYLRSFGYEPNELW